MEPNANGPLAEIEFWRERNASFAALSEQLGWKKQQKIYIFYRKVPVEGYFLILLKAKKARCSSYAKRSSWG